MNKIKVSIIVPVYNVEKYIGKCLDSLVNQTLKDIEIIVVNDGSLDNSQSIIDEYAKKYLNIHPLIKSNGGLSDARNYGIKYAKGEYLTFVDSDDYVREDMYELLYNKAIEERSDFVFSKFYMYDEIKTNLSESKKIENIYPTTVKKDPQILLDMNSYAWNKLYKTEWYKGNKFEFPKGQWFEDSYLEYILAYKANKISFVDECLYYYRIENLNSITHRVDEKIYDIFLSINNILNFFEPKYKNNAKLYDVICMICTTHLFKQLNLLLSSNNRIATLKFYNKTINFLNDKFPKFYENQFYLNFQNSKNFYYRNRHKKLLMNLYILLLKKKEKVNFNFSTYYISDNRLREMQLLELEILKKFKEICEKNNLTYYLSEGTLLGAIRHNGFIPWDDDLDVSMPRADYEKFLQIGQKELGDKYYLLNHNSYDKYYLPFSKIVLMENTGFINKLDKFDNKYCGIFIDVFPLDKVPSVNYSNLEADYKKIRKIRDILLLKSHYIKQKNIKKKYYNILSKFYSYDSLYNKLNKEMTKYNDEKRDAIVNFASSYHPSRQIVPMDAYGTGKTCLFEGIKFQVPVDSNKILTTIYDDFMLLPLITSRIAKHSFFDEYSLDHKYITKPIEDATKYKNQINELNELHQVELKILKELDRVCKKNNITYYLGEGTLLGAIRHNGFIPWDDDIDVYIPREDLNKLIELAPKEFNKDFKLQYYHNIDTYWVQSPKIRYLGESKFKQQKLKKYTDDIGPYIDLFPLDLVSSDGSKTRKQSKLIKRYRRWIWLKVKYSKPRNLKEELVVILVKFIPLKFMFKRQVEIAKKYSSPSSKYIANFGSYYKIINETFPKCVFGEPKYVKFEDKLFPVPSNYDYVLTSIYGNYMELPPEEKRKIKHGF